MSSKPSRDELQKQLIEAFSEIGDLFGLNKSETRHYNKNITSIYLLGKNALEIEIDWRENVLFMYVVRIVNGKIPDNTTIYKYDDSSWCRKYIDEIYNTKNHLYKSQDITKPAFLVDLIQYYKNLISNNPDILKPFFDL